MALVCGCLERKKKTRALEEDDCMGPIPNTLSTVFEDGSAISIRAGMLMSDNLPSEEFMMGRIFASGVVPISSCSLNTNFVGFVSSAHAT